MKLLSPPNHSKGYALLDLVVILLVLTVLSSFFVRSIQRGRQKANYLGCLNNTKQLITAWSAYQADNQNKLIESYHGISSGNDPKLSPWAKGWLDWGTSTDNTNALLVVGDRYSRLARYFGNNPKVVKCPADSYLSPTQKTRNWKERVRSYSMNIGMGAGNGEVGPWSQIYVHATKVNEISDPSMTWVFLDENADSIQDAGFFNPDSNSRFVDQPASYHNSGAGFSFADGHSEVHAWKDSLSRSPATRIRFISAVTAVSKAGDEDVAWLSARGGLQNPQVWFGAPAGR